MGRKPAEVPTERPKKARARSRVSSLAKGVTGRTIYMPDSLYMDVWAASRRRGETVSEYVTWVLEGQLGLRRRSAPTTEQGAETDAA